MTDYSKRLLIPIEGDPNLDFLTPSGLQVAHGYDRVVLGGRGPYIEFSAGQLQNLEIPAATRWRLIEPTAYYIEWRTKDECMVKVYEQRHTVHYADYRVGKWYISPFDLCTPTLIRLVEPLEQPADEPSEPAPKQTVVETLFSNL